MCVCVYSGCSVACISTGQGEGSSGCLAALCSRPLAPWINADCLGMTRSSGPHKESEGERRPAWGCRRGKQRGVHRDFSASDSLLPFTVSFLLLLPSPHTQSSLSLSLSITRNLSVSFFIRPLKTNELHSCLCFPGVKMKQLQRLQPLPAC